jgi:hypothetical protein
MFENIFLINVMIRPFKKDIYRSLKFKDYFLNKSIYIEARLLTALTSPRNL